jgi:SAM-dependent methyltransferase
MPVDEEGWWVVERARWVRSRVVARSRPGAWIVDVGSGGGGMFDGADLADRVVVNVDSHPWDTWRPRPGVHYVIASADALPFRDHAFDLVGSFDVLEHLPDDALGLSEQARVLADGGVVITAVPADRRLWSVHDDAVGHHRRYSSASFRSPATAAGLRVERSTHFFSFLWLPAFVTRRRAIRKGEPGNGAGRLARVLRTAIGACCRAERWVLGRVDVPFGTSLWFESTPADAPGSTSSPAG